jgi:hypothetical protein
MIIPEDLIVKIHKLVEQNINCSVKLPPITSHNYKFFIDCIIHYNNYLKVHIVVESCFSKHHETFYLINNVLY